MISKVITLELKETTKALFVSDIHLQLPVTPELGMIEKSLAERIEILSDNQDALLVLNGDIFEMWAQTDQTAGAIIKGFALLREAITKFCTNNSHRVIMVVGNHDEAVKTSSSYQREIKTLWQAELCEKLILNFRGKTALVEHGHEYDSYNKSENNGKTHGREMMQKTLPRLKKTMPTLFVGIDDVINRGYLPGFVLSKLVYKIIAPLVFPLTLFVMLIILLTTKDTRLVWAFLLVWAGAWVSIFVLELILRFIALHTLGGGSMFMRSIANYEHSHHFDFLVLGHTHQGKILQRDGYIYANSGCNDKVAINKFGWLGLYKFKPYLQFSELNFDAIKKQPFKYHERLVPLVK